MITISSAGAAKLDTTSNDVLMTIRDLVEFYNESPDMALQEKLDILERLMQGAAIWLTSHPPKNTATNTARWTAMAELADRITEEGVKLGVRFLNGPSDWKQIKARVRNYWLEYVAPRHTAGFQLAAVFEDWMSNGGANQSFWDYARINPPYMEKWVKYYGGTQKAEHRRVYFKEDGFLYKAKDGSKFDTKHLETCASGDGWAIFVVSPQGKIYAHKHVEGVYHHSTFLSGGPVICAGEMVVVDGVVKIITAKSGHYKPTPENIKAMIGMFPKIPGTAIVMPDFARNPAPAHRVREFKFASANPAMLNRAAVQAQIPIWALSGLAISGVVNKVAV